jgi:diaminobutyrate-2-oxoglutarate transaminase
LRKSLGEIKTSFPGLPSQVRGLGMIAGLEVSEPAAATAIVREAFDRGLVIELCGAKRNVIKILPPLTIDDAVLAEGLEVIHKSIEITLRRQKPIS